MWLRHTGAFNNSAFHRQHADSSPQSPPSVICCASHLIVDQREHGLLVGNQGDLSVHLPPAQRLDAHLLTRSDLAGDRLVALQLQPVACPAATGGGRSGGVRAAVWQGNC